MCDICELEATNNLTSAETRCCNCRHPYGGGENVNIHPSKCHKLITSFVDDVTGEIKFKETYCEKARNILKNENGGCKCFEKGYGDLGAGGVGCLIAVGFALLVTVLLFCIAFIVRAYIL